MAARDKSVEHREFGVYAHHNFFKRIFHNQALFADGVHQRRRLAVLMIGPVGDKYNAKG